MYSLATVRTLFSALRSELCSIGTGVTEKVTKTFHSFRGSSSPVAAGVREPMGASWVGLSWIEWWSSWVKWMGSVSTSIRGVRFTLYILGGNEWFRFPRHSVSGSTLLGLTWDSWCGKGTAPGCAWCLRRAMLLRGFRLFGVALHREPKGTKRQSKTLHLMKKEGFTHCKAMMLPLFTTKETFYL